MQSISRWFLYNIWYLRRPPWDSGVSPPELLAFIKDRTPGRALDLGCGTGTNAITLARHGWQVWGVDFAVQAIAQARRKASRAGVKVSLKVGDVTRVEGIRGSFDLILDIGCLHSLSKEGKEAYIANLDRLLAEGGTFLLYGFTNEGDPQAIGLAESDLLNLAQRFRLIQRQDGSDQGGRRPSSWLRFQK